MDQECGQLTVFFSLLLISFLLILNVCMEGIHVWMEKGAFYEQQLLSSEYAQANYHRELLEQFHIFAIDSRYVEKMEASLTTNWSLNTGNTPSALSISAGDNVSSVEVLKHEIREYMKYKETADLLKQLKNSLNGVTEEKKSSSMSKKVSNAKTEYSEKEKQKYCTDVKDDVKVEDPRKGLKKLLSGDILELVMPSGKSVSKQSVRIIYGTQNTASIGKINFFQKKSVSQTLKQNKKTTAVNNLTTEGLAVSYAAEVCRCATDSAADQGIQYELEYIAGGKKTDKQNLTYVVNRILLMRFALNYSYLFSSSSKQSQAEALAAGIAGAANAIPGIRTGIKLLLMAAWAYGESVIDVKGLLAGKRMAVTKNNSNWQLSLSNLAKLKASPKASKSGITYKEYLEILVLLQSNKNEKYKRLMDVMEQRIQEKQPTFSMKSSLFSFRMSVTEEVAPLLFGTGFTFSNTRTYAY